MITQVTQSSVSTSPSSAPPATNTPTAKIDGGPDAPSAVSVTPSVVVSVSPEGQTAALMDTDLQDVLVVTNGNCPGDIASTVPAQEQSTQPKPERASDLDAVFRHLGDHGKQALGHVNALGSKVADRASELTEDVKQSPEFAALRDHASETVRHVKALKDEVVGQVKELKNEVKQSHEFQEAREHFKEVKDKLHKVMKKFRW